MPCRSRMIGIRHRPGSRKRWAYDSKQPAVSAQETTQGNVPRPGTPTPYEAWVERQGIPVLRGYGVSDVDDHEFGYWDRLGCPAYFVLLHGMEGITGMYMAEIP